MAAQELLLTNFTNTTVEQQNNARGVVEKLLRPLVSNLLREPTNIKYQSISRDQKLLMHAIESVAGTAEWLELCGFRLNAKTSRYEIDSRFANYAAAEAVLSNVEAACTKPQLALESRAARDREARLAELRKPMAPTERSVNESDVVVLGSANSLLPTIKKTLHVTGRVRNASFSGIDFVATVMKDGRVHVCQCADDSIEVHWHVKTANMLYAHAAHVSPDGETVLHMCPELGYQYNAVPRTENFQRTVLMSRKDVDVDGKLLSHDTPNTAQDRCLYCRRSFDDLWV